MYLRIAFEVAVAAVLMRCWRLDLRFFWISTLTAGLIDLHRLLVLDGFSGWQESAAWGHMWNWLPPIATLARALAASEAYQRTLAPDFHPLARMAGRGSQLLAVGLVLILVAVTGFYPAGSGQPTGSITAAVLMAATWLKVWTAAWLGTALLFQALWPGLRIGFIRHLLLLEGLLLVQLIGALGRITALPWAGWHALNDVLYVATIVLLAAWSIWVPSSSPGAVAAAPSGPAAR